MSTTHDDLVEYLERGGWRRGDPGAYGSLWAVGASDPVGITHNLSSASPDWEVTLGHLARAWNRELADVRLELQLLRQDEVEFAAPGAEGGIGLDAGSALFELARRAVRATASAAYSPRPAIKGNVPVLAQRVAEQVTFGHTRVGSYAVPVRYPLDRVLTDQANDAAEVLPETDQYSEAVQRRASRTLMQALSFISTEIIRPDKEPSLHVLRAGVEAGVTLELVTALRDLLRRGDDFDSIKTSAHWATLVRPPRVESRVVIETDAVPVLRMARDKLAEMQPLRQEVISGPLAGVEPLDPEADRRAGVSALVKIQTVRGGRSCKVQVRTQSKQWHLINEWLHSGDIVVAHGTVVQSGGALVLQNPSGLHPIGQVMLPGI